MPANEAIAMGARNVCDADPAAKREALEMYEKVCGGEYLIDGEVDYADVFLQSYGRPDPIVAGHLLLRLHWLLVSPEANASAIRIGTGQPPGKDRERQRNRAILRTIPAPFTATFEPGSWGADGALSWDPDHEQSPHHLHPAWRSERDDRGRDPSITLEVGYCPIETVSWYLDIHGALARWPYHSTEIIAFVIDPAYMRERARTRGQRPVAQSVSPPAMLTSWP